MKGASLKCTDLYLFLSIFKIQRIFFILILWLILSQVLSVAGVDLEAINSASLSIILLSCFGFFSHQLIYVQNSFLHPITWFSLTSALYFGLGPLVYYFGSNETIVFLDSYYILSADSLYKVNSIVIFGLLTVIFFYLLFHSFFITFKLPFNVSKFKVSVADIKKISSVTYFLIIIGVPVKLFLTLPYAIGIFDWHLPGFLKNFEHFATLALIPLYLIKSFSLKYKVTFYALTIFNFLVAFVTLSKLAVIIVMFVLFLAAKLKGVSNFRLGLVGFLIIFIYLTFLSPLVAYGRNIINVGGVNTMEGLQQFIAAVTSSEPYDFVADTTPGVQLGWARLNYSNAQAFAIEQYDSGAPGNTLSDILWVLVPRTLFSDKPNFSHGSFFNELVDGNPNSSSGPGMIVEGYWNAGWGGVIFVCFSMALIYFLWEKYINLQLSKSNFQYLPVIFLGIFSALTHDSWFVMSIFAIVPLAITMHFLIKILFSLYRNYR